MKKFETPFQLIGPPIERAILTGLSGAYPLGHTHDAGTNTLTLDYNPNNHSFPGPGVYTLKLFRRGCCDERLHVHIPACPAHTTPHTHTPSNNPTPIPTCPPPPPPPPNP